MEWLTLPVLTDVGSTGLVIIFVIAILTGKLRPQSAVKELREDRDARVAEANALYTKALEMNAIFEKAYNTSESARVNQAKVLEELIATVKAVQGVYETRTGQGGENPNATQRS